MLFRTLLLIASTLPCVTAQTTFATITGSVTDSSGAVVAGVGVTATHVATNYRYSAVSNATGQYSIPQLREGAYEVRAQAQGFREVVVRDLQLAARDIRRVDLRLEVGTVESTVQVTAGATLIETETARIGDTRTSAAFKDLPLNTRGLADFIALTPNVGRSSTTDSQRRFSGSRMNQNDAQIDGISISGGRASGGIGPLMSYVESFQEVRVDTANNSAEFGPIGMVTIISRSGNNRFHGSAFDYYSTPWFRARNPFSPSRPTGIAHFPGYSAGGPVFVPKVYDGRNRTFFFHSLEVSRGSARQDLLNPTVAPVPWRTGDFSLERGVAIRDPFGGNQPFSGNRMPASRLNPVTRKIQERFFPVPNFGDPNAFQVQNFREVKVRGFDPDTYWTSRIDHRFSDKSSLFGRITWNHGENSAYEGNLPAIGQLVNPRDTRSATVSYTQLLPRNLVNEFRWGLTFNDNPRHGPVMGAQLAQELGLQGLAPNLPDINGLYRVAFSGIGLTGINQTQWRHPGFASLAYHFQDHLSWYHGRHSVKAGALLGRSRFRDGQASQNLFGFGNFSNRFSGHPYSDFLLGIPTTAARAFAPILISQWRWNYEFFVTDQFKVTPWLTLDLGLRYEVRPYWRDRDGRQSIFDVASGSIVIADGGTKELSSLMPAGFVPVITANQAGLPSQTLIRTDRNNIAPRIGVALRPWGSRTVFRTGFGMFYDTVPIETTVAGVPFQISEPNFTNPANNPSVVLPLVFPNTSGRPSSVSLPTAISPSLRIPYSMQWNFTIEHERWNTGFRASYIGTNTRQGEWVYDINQPVADTRPYVDKLRMFPRYSAINYRVNGAGHQYHALTLEAERQLSGGMMFQAGWVWARDIGDLERGQSPEDAYDRRRERAVWADVPAQRFTSAVVWQVPFGKGKRWLNGLSRKAEWIAGGWQISSMVYHDTGYYLTPSWTGPDPTGTRFSSSRTPAQVTIRPDILRDPNFAPSERTTARWFDPSAFAAPAAGRFGTSAKGVLVGPGSSVLHAGIYKSFQLFENVKLRWEWTATNALNHPNWSNPETNITSLGSVAVIRGTGGVTRYDASGPRNLRMGLRLEW